MELRQTSYTRSTFRVVQSLRSNEKDREIIEDYATRLTVLGNATSPVYSEKMFENLENQEYGQAITLAKALDSNKKLLYKNARESNKELQNSKQRTINAEKRFVKDMLERSDNNDVESIKETLETTETKLKPF